MGVLSAPICITLENTMKMRTLKRKRADYSRSNHWWYSLVQKYPWACPRYVHDFSPYDGSSFDLCIYDDVLDVLGIPTIRHLVALSPTYGLT